MIIIYKFENPEDSSVQYTGEYDDTVDVTNPQETEETGLSYSPHSDQDLDLPFHPGDVTDFLSENNNYNISRWEKLAGIK